MNYIRLQRHVDTVSSHCLESLRFARKKKNLISRKRPKEKARMSHNY